MMGRDICCVSSISAFDNIILRGLLEYEIEKAEQKKTEATGKMKPHPEAV